MLARTLLEQGRQSEGRPLLERCLAAARAQGERRIIGVALLCRAVDDDAAGAADDAVIPAAREAVVHLRALESLQLLAKAVLARLLAERGGLAEALGLVHAGLSALRGLSSSLDDEFSVWAAFVRVLGLAGADDDADRATREALARLARLSAEIEDPEILAGLGAYPPVVALTTRARRRGLLGAARGESRA